MKIWLNDNIYSPVMASDLLALVGELTLSNQAIAIAISGEIIPRKQWKYTLLSDGIKVAVFQAIAGG
ncbi:sulfur carrier protein ThiS [Candidatus Enterovibrio escicola]|nr:sulfur carrier protein ThiS [Candidatus Enterovibrio escacola]